MSRKDPALFLEDILDSMNKIINYTANKSFEEFRSNSMAVDAVLRNLEVIGEASTNIPMEMKDDNPDIPWRRMVGLRNIVIHEYFGVDLKIIWRVSTIDIPETKPMVEELLEEIE
ncbi:MAG: DUF86 domain-containing protein [Candidatus Saliniplasma sp.]